MTVGESRRFLPLLFTPPDGHLTIFVVLIAMIISLLHVNRHMLPNSSRVLVILSSATIWLMRRVISSFPIINM